MIPESHQSLSHKQAEVTYRTRLEKGNFARQEPFAEELDTELKKRIKRTKKTFQKLRKQKLNLSPFLEIGAERGQRAMLLVNDYKAQGIMLDLSLESLRKSRSLRYPLGLKKIPKSICADAYNLPFQNNTLAFIFTFQTLHHFPDPKPVLAEIYRVLAPGGTFLLDEEPVRQSFNLRLWRRPTKLSWWEKLLKTTTLLHFLSEIGKSEVDAGIIETSFSLPTWEKALNVFDAIQANLTVFPFGPTTQILHKPKKLPANKPWLTPSLPIYFLLNLLGGNIQALCQKFPNKLPATSYKLQATSYKLQANNKLPPFACPTCPQKPLLEKQNKNWYCPSCKDIYPEKEGIPILIKKDLRIKLYPHV